MPAPTTIGASAETIQWGQMLADWIEETDPSSPEDPNPPELIEMKTVDLNTYLPLIMR